MPRLVRLHNVPVDDLPVLQGLSTTLVKGSIYLVRRFPRYHRHGLEELALEILPEPLGHLCVVAKDLKKLPWTRLLDDHVHPEDRVLYVVLVEDHCSVHPWLVLLLDQTEAFWDHLLLEELVDYGVPVKMLILIAYLELASRIGAAG